MATILHNVADDRRRVHGPLEKLRGYIRTYVGLEGLAFVVFFLALWFWLGLFFDFGLFKLFGFDGVQEASWVLRLVVLLGLVGLLLVVLSLKLFVRLFREFSDPALAIVLERRFPRELGDRLITAVEIADLKKAGEQG